MTSGNGPPAAHDAEAPRSAGYRITVSSERSPRRWPVTPRCAGSAMTICRSPTRYWPAKPGECVGAADADADADAGLAFVGIDTTRLAELPQPAPSTTAASIPATISLARISRDRRAADTTAAS